MANLKEMSKSELTKAVESARRNAARLRAETRKVTGRVVNGTMIVGGGAAVGAMRGMGVGNVPGTEIGWDVAISAGLATASIFDMAGEYSEQLGSIAFGMGAAAIAPVVERAVSNASE